MIRDCQDIRTLYCPNIKQLFLLMVAFGMCMRDVNILNGLRVTWTSGKNKLTENKRRDVVKIQALKELGWKVIIVWECELKRDKQITRLNKLYLEITQKEQET